MQSSCQTSPDWEATNYSDRTSEILICLPDLVHRHSHGSVLLIDHQEANNMGYLHAAWDKALLQWSGRITIWAWLAWRMRLQNQDRAVIKVECFNLGMLHTHTKIIQYQHTTGCNTVQYLVLLCYWIRDTQLRPAGHTLWLLVFNFCFIVIKIYNTIFLVTQWVIG